RAQGPELRAEISELRVQGPELKAEISELKAKISELRAEISELRAQGPELRAEISELKVQGPELRAEISELKVQGPEVKAQNTDTDKAARISTIFKETESSQGPNQETKEVEGSGFRVQGSGLRAQSAEEAEGTKLEAEGSKLKAETRLPLQGTSGQGSQPEAQRSTLKDQSLNSNLQEAGEVVKNLIKNQASYEATPKIEGNFQDIKTIAKNMENFDKNFSHKEPDNVLLFPDSRSSDRVSDTGLHAKETQLIQKPLQTEVLTQIVKKAVFNLKNGQTEVKIDLKPEFLGRIQLKISTENHQVMVRMLTEIPLVKDIIENNINHLKAELQSHGLEIDKFDVFLARDSDQYENGHENAEFLKKNGEPGEEEADGILAKEMEEEVRFAHERTGANLIGVFA
ncbi:MAG: flagellar hook-length control protein FliK, partial [Desulfobacterales bacterium]|nr:flagellar hook-length control protein FliK [Desulfobacterales bacterium]